MKAALKNQKLLFVSCLFLLLLSFPFIKLMNKQQLVAGIPLLYFYTFFIWLLSIVVIGLIAEFHKTNTK